MGDETSLFWSDLGGGETGSWCGSSGMQACVGARLIDFTLQLTFDAPCPPNFHLIWNGNINVSYAMPTAKLSGNYVYVYSVNSANYFGIIGVNKIDPTTPPVLAITPFQASAIDTKIDDGIPISGNVQAFYFGNWAMYCAITNGSDCTPPPLTYAPTADSTTSCYNTTTNQYSTTKGFGDGKNCSLSFKF